MKTVLHSQIYFSILIILFMSMDTATTKAQTQLDPEFLWAVSAGGFAYDNSRDVVTDNAGNIFITGSYDVFADFGDTTLVTETENVFIAKLDTDGNFMWAKSVLNFGTIEVVTITLDNTENIIIAGNFAGRFQIESGEELLSAGGLDVVILKYSPDGDFIWLNQFGGIEDNRVNDISTDTFNNIYFTGYNNSPTTGSNQIYTASFNEAGVFQWQRSTTGIGFYDKGTGICVNNMNNIFVTGAFGDTKIFEGSNALTQDSIVISNGITDIFLAKYDVSGNLIWVQNVDNPDYDEGAKLSADLNGDIVLTGLTSAVSGANVYLAKYSEAGSLIWETLISFFPYNVYPKMALDNAGNISVIYLSSLGDNNSSGLGEIYFSRVNSQGVHLWTTNYGGFDFDDPGDVDIDINGDIVLSGGYSVEGFFGDTTLISIQASRDVFVTKVAAPKINYTPGIAEFGDVVVGENLQVQVLVENTTGTTLYFINSILIEENLESNFSIISGLPVDSLLPFQSVNVDLLFAPQNTGLKTGYLIFETDSPTSPDTVLVTGRGIINSLTLSADTLNFGSLDVNLSSELTFSLFNDGTETIILSDILITGPNENEFGLIGQLQDSIPPTDSRTFRVIYTPSVPGPKNASLEILSSSTSSPDSIILLGNAITAIIVQQPDSVKLGESTTLTVTPPEGLEVLSSQFYYKRTGEPIFQQSEMTLIGTDYAANIPLEYSTIRGIQYYVEFSGVSELITFPSTDPINSPASLEVSIDEFAYPQQMLPSEYGMVSIPLTLNNPDISSVLQDDYGPYNNSVWRIFRWDELQEDYLEFPDLNADFTPGNSFWLIQSDGNPFNVNNAASVQSFSSFNIRIQPGWNQIANPFAFPVDWFSIENSQLLDTIQPVRWNIDSLDYEYNQFVLNPWEGYWLFNPLSQTINLSVPPVESIGNTPLPKSVYSFSTGEFIIQVRARLENSRYNDNQNFVGMINNKNNLYGSNIYEAPPIKNNIRLSIIGNDKRYAQNVVPVNADGAYWHVQLSTVEKNKEVSLSLIFKNHLPEDFDVWILNLDSGIPIPINNNMAKVFTGESGNVNLQLIIGTENYAKETAGNISLTPEEYVLNQNYPNPFNPSTTISYNLKEKSNVTLEVFDILGRKIKSLVDGEIQTAGQHTVIWNGKNISGNSVSSGVYLYRIHANDFIETKKMLLLR
ncbi:MAG: choice-of-anchor D domain-containing protein [Ignavibacteriaceae bacterium]